jgi:putative transposase
MSSTHLSLHYHVVFGTKNHEPTIQRAWRGDLHAYLGGIIRAANGIAESVGGVSDHVRLLIGPRATHRLADVLRELKSVSSRWVHEEIGLAAFAWQALAQKQNFVFERAGFPAGAKRLCAVVGAVRLARLRCEG